MRFKICLKRAYIVPKITLKKIYPNLDFKWVSSGCYGICDAIYTCF